MCQVDQHGPGSRVLIVVSLPLNTNLRGEMEIGYHRFDGRRLGASCREPTVTAIMAVIPIRQTANLAAVSFLFESLKHPM